MMKKIRENDKFKGLVNGRHYVVSGPVNGHSVDLKDVDGGMITVPRNALEKAFIFEGNDTPFPATKDGEYIVAGGHLFKDGQMIETGTLRPVSIIDYVDGGVYLTVKAKNAEDGQEIRFYEPEKDHFFAIPGSIDTVDVIYNDRQTIGLVTRRTYAEEIPSDKEGGEKEVVTGVEEKVVFLNKATLLHVSTSCNRSRYLLPHGPVTPVAETAEKAVDANGNEQAYARHIFFALDRKVEMKFNVDGEAIFVEVNPGEVIDRRVEKSLVMKVSVFYDGYRLVGPDTVFPEKADPRVTEQVFEVDGLVREIDPVYDEEMNAMVVTDQGIVFSNFGFNQPRQAKGQDVLDLVRQYPHCLSLWVNRPGTESVFTLCDDGYNMATIKVVKTRDRGFVNTITVNPGFSSQPQPD